MHVMTYMTGKQNLYTDLKTNQTVLWSDPKNHILRSENEVSDYASDSISFSEYIAHKILPTHL